MNELDKFYAERRIRVCNYENDPELRKSANKWIEKSMTKDYVYNFDWLGRPIIQFPEDIVGIQELIWKIKPDTIIETGVAHGGSLVLSASILAMLDLCEAISSGQTYDPKLTNRRVLGIDIEIRQHNKELIEAHPLFNYITLIEGSSTTPEVISRVETATKTSNKNLVLLDSNHTHDHVLKELEAYSSFVTLGSYCVVFDTFVEIMPRGFFPNRPWDVGDNPMTAVKDFLNKNRDFVVDNEIDTKLQITVAKSGFLKRIK